MSIVPLSRSSQRARRVWSNFRLARLAMAASVEYQTKSKTTIRAAISSVVGSAVSAGVIVQGPLELVPQRELERQFAINTLGPVYVTQAFLPLLRAGRGRLINISAPTARVPVPFLGPIGASKAALESLSAALRGELAAWGIPVVLVEPGGTDTQIFARATAAAEAALAAGDPARIALYRPHLEAFAKAAVKQSLGPVEPVADAVVTAIEARRPKRRYSSGNGVRLFGTLSHVPIGLRERLVASAFGLNRVAADVALDGR